MPKQVRHDSLAYFTLSGVEAEAMLPTTNHLC